MLKSYSLYSAIRACLRYFLFLEAIRSLVIGVASRFSYRNVTFLAYSYLIGTKDCHNLVFKIIDYNGHYFYYG
jgi:hypothetical protein